MKKIITSAMLFLAFNGFAQLVQGEINIKEQSKIELTSKSNKAVNLFADFRENKYPIHFAFTATDVPLNSDKKEVVQFVFSTTIKKDGKRLYEHARAGEEVEIQSRKTTIYEFEITRIALPEIDFRVKCSKGTYIRSLAYDFGLALQSGGHLTALRRTKIGDYDVKNAISPEDFEKQIKDEI